MELQVGIESKKTGRSASSMPVHMLSVPTKGER